MAESIYKIKITKDGNAIESITADSKKLEQQAKETQKQIEELGKKLLKIANTEAKEAAKVEIAWNKAILEDKKRTTQQKIQAEKEYIDKQLQGINALALRQRQYEADVNRIAANRLRNAGKQISFDAGFQGQFSKIDIGSQAHINQLKAIQRTLSPLSAEYQKLANSIKAYQNALRDAKGSNFGLRGLLEMGENISVVTGALGILSGKVLSVTKDIVNSFLKQEEAINRLRFALDGNGGTFKRLVDDASQLQNLSIFPDEEIVKAQSFLALQGRTETEIKKVIRAAIDLAAVTGDDLQSAVSKLDATYEGNIGKLGKLDSGLKGLSQEQLANGDAVTILGEKYKGLGNEIANTTEGKIKRFQNQLDELKESLGEGFVSQFAGDFDKLGNSVSESNESTSKAVKLIGEFVAFQIKGGVAGKLFRDQVDGIAENFKKAKGEIEQNVIAVKDFIRSIGEMGGKSSIVSSFFGILQNASGGYLDNLLSIISAQDAVTEGMALREDLYTSDGKRINTRDPMKDPAKESNKSRFTSSRTGSNKEAKEQKDLLGEELNTISEIVKLAELEKKLNVDILKFEIEKVKSLFNENLERKDKIRILEKEFELTEKISNLTKEAMEQFALNQNMFAPFLLGTRNKGQNAIDNGTGGTAQGTIQETDRTWENIYNSSTNILTNFSGMLEITGLMRGEFGQIIQIIQGIIGSVNSGFNLFGGLFDIFSSFIPGASAVTAIARGASGMQAPRLGGIKVINNTPIVFKNTIDGMTFTREIVNASQAKLAESYT